MKFRIENWLDKVNYDKDKQHDDKTHQAPYNMSFAGSHALFARRIHNKSDNPDHKYNNCQRDKKFDEWIDNTLLDFVNYKL